MSSRNLRHSRQVPCSWESSGVFQLRCFKLAAWRFRHVAIWRDPFLGGRSHSRFTVSSLASLSSHPGTIDHHTVVYEYLDGRRLMSLKSDTSAPVRVCCALRVPASEGWTGAETACISTTALRPVLRRQIRQEQEHMLSRTPAPMATSWSESGVPA